MGVKSQRSQRAISAARGATAWRLLVLLMVFALLASGYGYVLSTLAQQQQQRIAAPVMKVAQSRRYGDLATKVDKDKLYEPEEAVALVKELATAKFTETT